MLSFRLVHLLFLHPGPPGINCCFICTQFQCHKPVQWPKLRFMKVWPGCRGKWPGCAPWPRYNLDQFAPHGTVMSWLCAPHFGLPSPRFHKHQGSRGHCGNRITGQNDFHFLPCRKACSCREGQTLPEKVWGSIRYPGAERAAPSDADLAVVRRCFKKPSAPLPLGWQPPERPDDQGA